MRALFVKVCVCSPAEAAVPVSVASVALPATAVLVPPVTTVLDSTVVAVPPLKVPTL